jgi:hypothetical protein
MAKESERFVLYPLKLRGVQPRVRILIVRVIDPKLRRSVIKEHPELGDLSILKQPQGTNFRVTPEEVGIIKALLVQ